MNGGHVKGSRIYLAKFIKMPEIIVKMVKKAKSISCLQYLIFRLQLCDIPMYYS